MPSLFFAISHGAIRKTFRGVSGRSEIPFRGGHNHVPNVIKYGSGRDEIPRRTVLNTLRRKPFGYISLKKKKLLGRMHWIGNEVETSEALEVAGICTNKGRLSFESAMLL